MSRETKQFLEQFAAGMFGVSIPIVLAVCLAWLTGCTTFGERGHYSKQQQADYLRKGK